MNVLPYGGLTIATIPLVTLGADFGAGLGALLNAANTVTAAGVAAGQSGYPVWDLVANTFAGGLEPGPSVQGCPGDPTDPFGRLSQTLEFVYTDTPAGPPGGIFPFVPTDLTAWQVWGPREPSVSGVPVGTALYAIWVPVFANNYVYSSGLGVDVPRTFPFGDYRDYNSGDYYIIIQFVRGDPCGMAGGGPPVTFGPARGGNSELLDTRRAFYHAFAPGGDTGIAIYRSDQSFLPFTYATIVPQTAGSFLNTVEPRLERMEPADLVDLIFQGGFATPTTIEGDPQPTYGLYRLVSADRAESWSIISPSPPDTQLHPFFPQGGATDKSGNLLMAKYGRQVWNCHTQEYLLFYNDATDKDSMGNPTGQGYIQCNVYNAPPDGTLFMADDGSGSPFPVDINTMSADSSFDAFYCTDPTAHIRVAFTDTMGAIHHYISCDDGRTYNEVAPYVVSG